jgi:hypothetical protein
VTKKTTQNKILRIGFTAAIPNGSYGTPGTDVPEKKKL